MAVLASIAVVLSLSLSAQVSPAALEPPVAGATTAALEVPEVAAPLVASPFVVPRSNETMEFSVSYLGVTMGKVRLFVGKVDPSIAPVFLQAQTSSILSLLTIRQQVATYLDVSTGLPRSGSIDGVEGSYRHTDTVQYDRTTNKATVREKGKYDNTYLLDVPPDTLDFVALVYWLRSLPLEPGTKHDFRVLTGRKVNSVVAEVVAREQVETKAGTFQAVKVRVPTGFDGKFSEKDPTYVWFSDDARRVVVRITANFAIGHATAGLVSYAPGAASIVETAAASR
jgi:Protein of unknown function (DUF3108)